MISHITKGFSVLFCSAGLEGPCGSESVNGSRKLEVKGRWPRVSFCVRKIESLYSGRGLIRLFLAMVAWRLLHLGLTRSAGLSA